MRTWSALVVGLISLSLTSSFTLAQPNTCPGAPRVVDGVGFSEDTRMFWEAPSLSRAFNVYLDRDGVAGSGFAGECLYWAVPESATLLHGEPRRRIPWMFQVTGLFAGGEGPMGFADDCTPIPPPRPCTCTMPADPGPCDAVIPRWYFDFQQGQCLQFIWGGCSGNANNFPTAEACKATCLDPCKLPAVVGDCDAAVPRWYFSALSGHCEPFVWGGCGGNANNFPNEHACRATCGDRCDLPVDPGPCDGSCPRWYHNTATGQCEPFVWGCCGGNANNFLTELECQRECVDVCNLPPDPGPCDGDCPRWFYDPQIGQCRLFQWGCCLGNPNNFETLDACEAQCP